MKIFVCTSDYVVKLFVSYEHYSCGFVNIPMLGMCYYWYSGRVHTSKVGNVHG